MFIISFQVAGPYLTQYDVYYKRLDPNGANQIPAMDAAGFLKKSGLTDEILGKIWDLSDEGAKGYLDRKGFFAACKFVALSQVRIRILISFDGVYLKCVGLTLQDCQDVMICNLKNESPAPFFGDATAPGAPIAKGAKKGPVKASVSVNFLVKPEEKRKYDALFNQLQPVDEKLPGDKVREKEKKSLERKVSN